jgi:RIO kinase 3
VFKRGVVGKGDQMKSKHDILLSNRHNGAKVMDFPPEFDTGDKHGLDLRLSNQVFNKLKSHSHQLGKRTNRVRDKRDQATNEISLDPRTRLILFKFVNADLIDSIGGVVSTGKVTTTFNLNNHNLELKILKFL